MRRAIIFRYDAADRRVRAAGAHGLEPRAVRRRPRDRRVGADRRAGAARGPRRRGRRRRHAGRFPRSTPRSSPSRCGWCARRWPPPAASVGVILADRLMLAAAARRRRALPAVDAGQGRGARLGGADRCRPRPRSASQLEQRIDLAREIHEGVIQRLFGVSMALDGDGRAARRPPAGAAPTRPRRRSTDLRTRAAAPARPRATRHADDVRRGGRAPGPRAPRPRARRWSRARRRRPGRARAARPVGARPRRCATPTSTPRRRGSRVRVGRADGAFVLEVVNDGVARRRRRAGHGPAAGRARGPAERRRGRVRRARARHLAGAPGRPTRRR